MLFLRGGPTLWNLSLLKTTRLGFQIGRLPLLECILPQLLNDLNNPFSIYFVVTCKPHSFLLLSSHHQRPALKSSPGWMARVHAWQPLLGKPLSCNGFYGTPRLVRKASTSANVQWYRGCTSVLPLASSHSTIPIPSRLADCAARIPVIHTLNPFSARFTGSMVRMSQHSFRPSTEL